MNNFNIKKNVFLGLVMVFGFFALTTHTVFSQSLGEITDNRNKLIVENPRNGPSTSPFSYSSCPDGSILVGFNIYNAGGSYSKNGSLYCKSISFGLGDVTAVTKNVIESPWGGPSTSPFADSSCPEGSVLVGFNIHNAGGVAGKAGSLYCKALPTSIKLGSVDSYVLPVLESPNWLSLPASREQILLSSCPDGSVLVGFNLINVGENYSFVGALYCKQLTLPVFNYSLSAKDITSLRPNKTGSGVVTATLGEGSSVNSTYHGNCYVVEKTGQPREIICTSDYPVSNYFKVVSSESIPVAAESFAKGVCGPVNFSWKQERGITTFACIKPITTFSSPITKPVALTLAKILDASGKDILGKTDGRGFQLLGFNPTSVTPTALSNITLKPDANVPEGTYTAFVTGNPGSTKSGGTILTHQISNMSQDTTKSISYFVCTDYKDVTRVRTPIRNTKGSTVDYSESISSSGCKDYSPIRTETLQNALEYDGNLGAYSFYNDKYTRDKVCSILFPDTPINTHFTEGGYSTPRDNGSIYWDESKGAFVVVNASYNMTGNYFMKSNNVVRPYSTFICSNKPTDAEIVNTTTTFKITVLTDRYDFKITSPGDQCNSSDLKLTATWDVVPGATGYNLYRSKDDKTFTKINSSLIAQPSSGKTVIYDDKTGVSGIIYGYKVVAVVGGVEQEASKVKVGLYPKQNNNYCQTPPPVPPPPPPTGGGCVTNCGNGGAPTTPGRGLYIEAREGSLKDKSLNIASQEITSEGLKSVGSSVNGVPTLKIKIGKTFSLQSHAGSDSNYTNCTLSNTDFPNNSLWTTALDKKKGYSLEDVKQKSTLVKYLAQCTTPSGTLDTVRVDVQIVDANIKET